MNTQIIPECSICYTDAEDGFLKCKICSTAMCVECCVVYFRCSKEEKMIPRCIKCQSTFYISTIKNIKELVNSYLECIKGYFDLQQGDDIRKIIEISSIVEKMRKEKVLFINTKFPKAVLLTVKLCMTKEMISINKNEKKRLELEQKQAIKKCFIMSCKGSLNSDFKCMLCMTNFCNKCERKLKNGHKCLKEDLESMEEMKKTVKCPECGIPSFKYVGCEMMTCPSCKTNYHYSSGEKTQHGNPHNADIKIENNRKISIIYEKELKEKELLELVIKIENLDILPHNKKVITTLLIKLDVDKSKELLLDLAKEFEKMDRIDRRYKNYNRSFVEIEELIDSNELIRKDLITMLEKLTL